MADTIGVKMKVEGETSFSKAMKDAAKNTKALDSELKLAQAEFKASGDAQKLMSDRGKILNEQLKEQEKAVSTAQSMLKELAKAGYEQNSSKVMEWRKKLAEAQQSVIEINGAIANNEKGLDAAGKKYEELGQSMQGIATDANTAKAELSNVDGMASSLYGSLSTIGSELGWSGLANGVKSINDTIDKVIRKAAQLAQALWDAGVDATVWADDLLTDATVYGIDTTTLQQWQYASRFVDTNVETIIKAREKLNQNMGSSSKEVALAFNELHVATRDVSGNLRSDNDVFWDTIAALGAIENASQRDVLAQKVLGKSYAELAPLIAAGREEWDKYANAAPVISEEKVKNLGPANDSIEDMNSQLESLKLEVLAELAPTIQLVADAVSKAAQSMHEFLESDEGQQAMTALSEAVNGVVKEFTEQDFGQVIQDAAKNVASFVQSFADLLKDKDKVVQTLGAIAGGIAGLKLLEAATNAAKLYSSLRLISAVKTVGGAAAGAGAAGATASGISIKSILAGGAKALGPVVAGLGTFFGPMIGQISQARENAIAAEAAASANEEAAVKAEEVGDTLQEAAATIATVMHEAGVDASTASSMYAAHADDIGQVYGLYQPPAKAAAEVDVAQAEEVIRLTEAQAEAAQKYWDIVRNGATPDQEAAAYQDLFDAFADSDESIAQLDLLMTKLDELPHSIETLPDFSQSAGENISVGLANGINARASEAITAAMQLANSVSSIIASSLMIASPSKVMEEYGGYIGQGLAIGMEDTEPLVAGAAGSMMNGITLAAPKIDTGRVQQAGGDSVPAMLLNALSGMRVEIDGKQAGTIILPTIEELMADQVNSRRWE